MVVLLLNDGYKYLWSKHWWLISRYYPAIWLQVLWKTMRNLGQGSGYSTGYFNGKAAGIKSEATTLQPTWRIKTRLFQNNSDAYHNYANYFIRATRMTRAVCKATTKTMIN
jgi:hypothetical protein